MPTRSQPGDFETTWSMRSRNGSYSAHGTVRIVGITDARIPLVSENEDLDDEDEMAWEMAQASRANPFIESSTSRGELVGQALCAGYSIVAE